MKEHHVKVFLTGGSGYIGRATIDALNVRGHQVDALARTAAPPRLSAGTAPNRSAAR
jgi:uncharacterized protein YbjT (DUF2867 family)